MNNSNVGATPKGIDQTQAVQQHYEMRQVAPGVGKLYIGGKACTVTVGDKVITDPVHLAKLAKTFAKTVGSQATLKEGETLLISSKSITKIDSKGAKQELQFKSAPGMTFDAEKKYEYRMDKLFTLIKTEGTAKQTFPEPPAENPAEQKTPLRERGELHDLSDTTQAPVQEAAIHQRSAPQEEEVVPMAAGESTVLSFDQVEDMPPVPPERDDEVGQEEVPKEAPPPPPHEVEETQAEEVVEEEALEPADETADADAISKILQSRKAIIDQVTADKSEVIEGPPPPPPPPPPKSAAPSAPPTKPQAAQKQEKVSHPASTPARSNLFAEIAKGIALRHVEGSEKKAAQTPANPDLAAITARRAAMYQHEDDEVEEEEEAAAAAPTSTTDSSAPAEAAAAKTDTLAQTSTPTAAEQAPLTEGPPPPPPPPPPPTPTLPKLTMQESNLLESIKSVTLLKIAEQNKENKLPQPTEIGTGAGIFGNALANMRGSPKLERKSDEPTAPGDVSDDEWTE